MYIHIKAEGESQKDLTFSFCLHWHLHTIHPYFDLLFFLYRVFTQPLRFIHHSSILIDYSKEAVERELLLKQKSLGGRSDEEA